MKAVEVRWIRDLNEETRFAIKGIAASWEERINISAIDVKGSLKNNARLDEAINQEHMFKIACAMESGNPIPGIVLRRTDKKLLFVVGGNHRIAALQYLAESAPVSKTVAGYIIECTDEEADGLTRTDNRSTGRGQPNEESYQHAYAMHKQYGTTVTELAKQFSVKADILQDFILAMKARQELEESGVNTDSLPNTSIIHLNTIRQNRDTFITAAQLAITYKVPCNELSDMTKQLRRCTSQPHQTATLELWRDELAKKAQLPKPQRVVPIRTKLFNILDSRTGLRTLLKSGGKGGKQIKKINELALEIHDARRLIEIWREISDMMKPLIEESKTWDKQHKDKK